MGQLLTNIGTLYGTGPASLRQKSGEEIAAISSLKSAWLLTEGENVSALGEMTSLPSMEGHDITDLKGATVIPAFCDSHTHLVFAKSREGEFEDRINGLSYEEIAARGGGILNSAAALKELSEDDLFNLSKERFKTVIGHGTGAIEIKSGYGLSMESELKMLRVIRRLKDLNWIPVRSTFLGAHALPPEYKGRKEEYVKMLINEMLPEVARQGLADYVDVFCEKSYFEVEDARNIIRKGAELGLRAKIHVNQFNSTGGIKMAVSEKALSVDHLEVMKDEDFQALKGSKTIATLLPSCSFFLGLPYAPARQLIDDGNTIALASDYNPGSSPGGNMSFVWSLACIKMIMTPAEALNAMTINGAAAMELSEISGSLCAGKLASLVVFPKAESLANIPYSYSENLVQRVMVNGTWF